MPAVTDTCPRCGVDDRGAFRTRPTGRREAYCRPCMRVYQQEYRDANRREVRDRQGRYRAKTVASRASYTKEWRRRNPGKTRMYKLRSKYGMSVQDFDHMVLGQCGLCAACGEQMTNCCIDHCHETGRVRALLCGPCNTSLGLMREDPERIAGLVKYALEVC